ncbi:hypothetical protein [Thalassovita mediterranea]|nr:hypothetical protein [Thalassovita mediterranea]
MKGLGGSLYSVLTASFSVDFRPFSVSLTMKRDLSQAPERPRFALRRAGLLFSILMLCAISFSAAPIAPAHAQSVVRVSNDGGGSLPARLNELRQLRNSGQRVEIRRGYCNSACTLYLGLENTCVSPNARFGFHGPQIATRGLRMLPDDFEKWSRTMAEHYPSQLKGWFLQTARHSEKLITVRGAQLIQMGVPRCG